jgi:lipid A ethanolaminephosphotransferase
LKRTISLELVTLAAAAFFAFALNVPFWRKLVAAVAPSGTYEWLFIGATAIAVLAAFNFILTILGTRLTFKPLVIALLPVTAGISYFMTEYGVVIDANMIQNVFETNSAEARDLFTPQSVMYVGLMGLVPAWLIWTVPVSYRPFWHEVRTKSILSAVSALVLAAVAFAFFQNFASVFREQKDLRLTLTPYNYIGGLVRYIRKTGHAATIIAAPFGEDAQRTLPPSTPPRKSVTVLVIGETARAANFSLNGYTRETNPRLAKVPDLINFKAVRSCGTDTAQSVPCMFSGLGRAKATSGIAIRQEGLLDILNRTGISLLWRENQSGCKGVCSRIPLEILTQSKLPTFYNNGESNDEVLLRELDAKIAALKGDGVFVLHMMGSHGPAYYKRYPPAFETFTPVCKSSQFSRCSNEEIVNAYDNTILYADHVLAELIALLQKADAVGVPASMIFVSDHGESLGENNIYLHGMPYALAPDVQTHVPMMMWLSPSFQKSFGVDGGCLAKKSGGELSHDNLFHSMLGLHGVTTKVYDPALDLFSGCRFGAYASPQTAIQLRPSL